MLMWDDEVMRERILIDAQTVRLEADSSTQMYFHFLEYFNAQPQIEAHHLVIGASFVYSWMPTMLRLHGADFSRAAAILDQARKSPIDDESFEHLVKTVNNSVVGVSKLLHFAAPNRYPIWDSRVANYLNSQMKYPTLSKISTYRRYSRWCDTIVQSQAFETAHQLINHQLGRSVSALRAVELVMYTNGSRNLEVSHA